MVLNSRMLHGDAEFIEASREDVPWLVEQVESLERWKFEALEVMSGLRELGKALGLGLGVQITGPAALAEVERLTAERDALAQIKRHIDEVRDGTGWTVSIWGVLLQQCDEYGKTVDGRRAQELEAENAALRSKITLIREYAVMRETYGKRGRSVHSSRVASDLLAMLADPEGGDRG